MTSEQTCAQYALDHPDEADDCFWATKYQTIIRESDGVVNAESQQGLPGAAGQFRMNYANHFQERNSEPTRIALIELFENGNGDTWFTTLKK